MKLAPIIAAIGFSSLASIAIASAKPNDAKIASHTYVGTPVPCHTSAGSPSDPQPAFCSSVNPPNWSPLVQGNRHGR